MRHDAARRMRVMQNLVIYNDDTLPGCGYVHISVDFRFIRHIAAEGESEDADFKHGSETDDRLPPPPTISTVNYTRCAERAITIFTS